jgi:hypothetical protein
VGSTFLEALVIAFLAGLVPSLVALDEQPPPDAARIKAAVVELDQAFESGGKDRKLEAISKAADVVDGQVAHGIGRGLKDKDQDVQRSAIEALRWMEHPGALEELHRAARGQKELRKEPVLFASLLRAVGQHGHPSSIEVLTEDLWSVLEGNVIRARILGLGRIRTKKAVEALIGMMKVTGRERIQEAMPDFRLALVELTGVDKGLSQQYWQDWWNENRGRFEVEPVAKELPRELSRRWEVYWAKDDPRERARRRERGQEERGDG